jgi:hypothetical protein
MDFKFDTAIVAPPVNGYVLFNNVAAASATHLFISETSAGGENLSTVLATFLSQGRSIIVQDKNDAANWAIYSISSFVDAGTYADVTVVYKGGNLAFADEDQLWLQVFPKEGSVAADTRNRVINGAMIVSQEYAVDTSLTVNTFPWDQWQTSWVTGGSPAAFARTIDGENYLRINSGLTVDVAIAATDIVYTITKIEGQNVKDFLWGTAAAKPAVLRFQARCATVSNLTIGVAVKSGVTAGDRCFIKNIALTSAWQDFVIPIPGDTSGTWKTDITAGILISFCAMAGANYAGGTDNAWNTGNYYGTPGNIMAVVQSCMDIRKVGLHLDPNNTGFAPPFEVPDYSEELRKCQRYWQQTRIAWYGGVQTTVVYSAYGYLPAVPRYTGAPTSGTNTANTAFPATVGTFSIDGITILEQRTSNATATFGRWITVDITVNARM